MAFWNEYNEVTGITYEDPPWVTQFIQDNFGGAAKAPQERQAFNPETGNIEFQRWNAATKTWDWTGVVASRPPNTTAENVPQAAPSKTYNGPQGYGIYEIDASGNYTKFVGNPQAPPSVNVSVAQPPAQDAARFTYNGIPWLQLETRTPGQPAKVQYQNAVTGEILDRLPPPVTPAETAKLSVLQKNQQAAAAFAKGLADSAAGATGGSSKESKPAAAYERAPGGALATGEDYRPGADFFQQPQVLQGTQFGTGLPTGTKYLNQPLFGGDSEASITLPGNYSYVQQQLSAAGQNTQKPGQVSDSDLALMNSVMAKRALLLAPEAAGGEGLDPIAAQKVIEAKYGKSPGVNENYDNSGNFYGAGRGAVWRGGAFGSANDKAPLPTRDEILALLQQTEEPDYMAEGGSGYAGMGEQRREWPADDFSRYGPDQTLPGPLDYGNNYGPEKRADNMATLARNIQWSSNSPGWRQMLLNKNPNNLIRPQWEGYFPGGGVRGSGNPSMPSPSAPPLDPVSLFPRGGPPPRVPYWMDNGASFMTPGPTAMVDMVTGQTQAVAGEVAPERIDVTPMGQQQPMGYEQAGTGMMGQPSMVRDMIHALFAPAKGKGRQRPLVPVGMG